MVSKVFCVVARLLFTLGAHSMEAGVVTVLYVVTRKYSRLKGLYRFTSERSVKQLLLQREAVRLQTHPWCHFQKVCQFLHTSRRSRRCV